MHKIKYSMFKRTTTNMVKKNSKTQTKQNPNSHRDINLQSYTTLI